MLISISVEKRLFFGRGRYENTSFGCHADLKSFELRNLEEWGNGQGGVC
jgi:hypothetical protein